jgi:hypothetical protein
VDHVLTLVRFDVFHSTLWAAIIAATTPDISPFFPIIRTTIIVDELPLRHFSSSKHDNESYLARG